MNYIEPGASGYTVYCDDVREEVGGKFSYMGIYKGVLITAQVIPQVLQKLCAVLHYSEPLMLDPAELIVRVFMPGQEDDDAPPAMETRIPVVDSAAMLADPDTPIERQARHLVLPIVFAQFNLEREGNVRVQVIRGNEIYRCGTLKIIDGTKEKSAA